MDTLHILFATPLLHTHLSVQGPILDFVKSQEFGYHSNGYMTHESLLECNELASVKKFITGKVKTYFYDYCGFDKEVFPELISSWANLHNKGDWAQQHVHCNSIISFAWYLSTPENCGDFIIYPHLKLFGNTLDFNCDNRNDLNSDNYGFTPQVGDIFIFPSSTLHSVDPSKSDSERISIAGNYIMRGTVNSGTIKVTL